MPSLFRSSRNRKRPATEEPNSPIVSAAPAEPEPTDFTEPDLLRDKDPRLLPNTSMAEIVSTATKNFRLSIPEYLASGVVDMSTGMLLGVDTVDDHPREILDLLAAATFDLFQGRAVTNIEDIWNRRRGTYQDVRYFQEILVNSQNLVHLFMRGQATNSIVAAVICRRNVNVGMLFAQARLVMRDMDTALA